MLVKDVVKDAISVKSGSEKDKPKVTIVTPTYKRNAEGLLLRCLNSASSQTFSDYEHIIIDDGSTDGSQDTIEKFAETDSRIVYIRHEVNSGLPAVRTNEGILRARGDAIVFLFDDNILESDFIERSYKALNETGADVVYTNVKMLSSDGNHFELGGWPLTLELMKNLNTIPNSGVLVRRSFFEAYGLYDPHIIMRRICDWDLWLRALWMGARFHHLDITSSTEYGLVSPNSIGNTIKWDVKVSYGYMLDESSMRERIEKLKPSEISEFDVLNTDAILPYVLNEKEWEKVIKEVYTPFLRRHKVTGFDPRLPSNRFVSNDAKSEWNFAWSPLKQKRRILVVSNAVNSWASFVIKTLSDESGTIVLNCPEWQLSSFDTSDLDMVILVDCTSNFILPSLNKIKIAGVPIIYSSTVQPNSSRDASDEDTLSRNFQNNSHINKLLGSGIFFSQPGISFTQEQKHCAQEVMKMADTIILQPDNSDHFSLEALCTNIFPVIASTLNEKSAKGRYDLSIDLEGEHSDESFIAPRDRCNFAHKKGIHQSWQSIAAVVESRHNSSIAVSLDSLQSLSNAEKIGLCALMNKYSVDIDAFDGAGRCFSAESFCGKLDMLEGTSWIRNVVRKEELKAILRSSCINNGNEKRISIFLNSEMISGSEVYGLMIARNLVSIGFDVQIFVPENSIYKRDLRELNSWLNREGLKPASTAPFIAGGRFLTLERKQQLSLLDGFLDFMSTSDISDVVICSGSMPMIALAGQMTTRMVFMALFQPSAYSAEELTYLRGKIAGVMSDSAWSLKGVQAICGHPGQLVRSSFRPSTTQYNIKTRSNLTKSNAVNVALGGTIQPRKRQREAIWAIKQLVDQGHDIVLNLYGYELDLLDDYVTGIYELVSELGLHKRVFLHGLVDLNRISTSNDVVLSASVDESLPQTLIALMKEGLIGVACLSGGIDELIIDQVTGYLTRDCSSAGIAEVLSRAIKGRDHWADITSRAQIAINSEYSPGPATGALLKLLIHGVRIASKIPNVEVSAKISDKAASEGTAMNEMSSYEISSSGSVTAGRKSVVNELSYDFLTSGFENGYDVRVFAGGGEANVDGRGELTLVSRLLHVNSAAEYLNSPRVPIERDTYTISADASGVYLRFRLGNKLFQSIIPIYAVEE